MGRFAAAALVLGLCGGWPLGPGPAAAQAPVAVNLVIGIDVSESVDALEHDLQTSGLAYALRHREVVAAIESVGGIAVTVFHWGNRGQQVIAIPWRRVRTRTEAATLSRDVARAPRTFIGKGTAVADAIRFAAELQFRSPYDAVRRVIDISGDGRDNRGGDTWGARDRAVAQGITINGLPILNEEPVLDLYYRDNVIGGPKAFLMPAADYATFADAMVAKLIREIGDPILSYDAPATLPVVPVKAER